jgi:glyoxylase-like metal-dependent hydrolase (beta-lactamase superfamily II)
MSRVTAGSFSITLVRSGVYHWDAGSVFGVVPKTLWNRQVPCDELNRVAMAFNSYVVETGDHTVLIETGGGDKMDDLARERMKLPPGPSLPEAIQQAGIDPESIDVVINSHLHWDHCGWNTVMRGDRAMAAFPRATYYARRGEWEHAHLRHPRDGIAYLDDNYDPLVQSGQMRLVDAEECAIVPGIRMHLAPGHNRDLMLVTAQSDGQTFGFLSDMAPLESHLAPTWIAAFDLYPLEHIDTKLKWLARAAGENWICGFAHEPRTAFTRIRTVKNRYEAYGDLAAVS